MATRREAASMNPTFQTHVESLAPLLEQLLAMAPVKPTAMPREVPPAGIYLFSEAGQYLYVGRSRRIKRRIRRHCSGAATFRGAAFAFLLAREATGQVRATYKTEGSRANLMKDPAFASAFADAKARIRAMDLRFVAEPDPIRQALLEIYAAVTLSTPHNDFDTH